MTRVSKLCKPKEKLPKKLNISNVETKDINWNSFKCDQCSFQTAHKRSLTRHKLIHNQDKPYLCNICHKKFSSINVLEQHSKQHIH